MKKANPYKKIDRYPLIGYEDRDTELIALYKERKARTLTYHTPIFEKLQRFYNVYRQSYDSRRFSAFKNFVQIHFTFAVIEAIVAQKVQSLFGAWPVVDFVGTSSDDVPIARKNSTLVSAQLRDCDSFLKAVDFFLSAEIYGTAVARLGWKTRGYKARLRVPTDNGGEQQVTGWVTTFDGPDWDVVDILDFWPQPGMRRLRDCKWVMHRYWIDMDEIKAREEAGEFKKGSYDAVLASGAPEVVTDAYAAQRNYYRNLLDYEARQGDKFQRRVMCVDLVGFVPRKFQTDGITNRIITIANDRVVLKDVPFPFHHGRLDKMFFAYSPVPDPHYLHGIGKAEVMEKMQYLVNRYASQKADAVDQAIEPMWIVNELGGVDLKSITTRAGKVIKVAGPVDDSNIRPFSPDLRGIPLAQNEIQQTWEFMQIATGGIQDVGLGGEGPNRETATSVATRSQRALNRGMLETRVGEESFVVKVAEAIRDLNRQFLQLPHEVMMIGSEAQINPITGMALPSEPTIISHFDVAMDYKAIAIGASQQLGKQNKQQNILTLLQIVSSNPMAQKSLNWQAMFTYVFKTFDLPNVQEFFVTQPNQLNEGAANNDPNAAVNAEVQNGMGGGAPGAQMPEMVPSDMLAMINSGGMFNAGSGTGNRSTVSGVGGYT